MAMTETLGGPFRPYMTLDYSLTYHALEGHESNNLIDLLSAVAPKAVQENTPTYRTMECVWGERTCGLPGRKIA